MATQKQIEANRRNAALSTGPRTAEGKRASSQNALKSGLDAESQFVPGESAEEFAQLQADYFSRFSPATPEQRFQVDTLIRNEWMLRRFHRVEAHLFAYQTLLCDRSSGAELGEAFTNASTIFMRLERRMRAAEKSYKEAMSELTRLRQPAQPEETEDQTSQLASFLNSGSEALADFAISRMLQTIHDSTPPENAPDAGPESTPVQS